MAICIYDFRAKVISQTDAKSALFIRKINIVDSQFCHQDLPAGHQIVCRNFLL